MSDTRFAIYKAFLDRCVLTPETEVQLRGKRGFTQSTIDAFKIKSAIPENEKIIEGLIKVFGLGAVFESGLCMNNGKPSYQFVKEGMIIIPYLHENGDPYFFKSHKNGDMTGHKPIPYCDKLYKSTPTQDYDTLVFCESEFKAIALWQLGWRSVGLGGVSKFSGELFERIAKLISDIKPKRTIILFDTEVQDDPAFANYKDHFRKRYAQYIYSYIMAKKIQLQFPEVFSKIAQLPFDWMIDNKADIDSCVADGKTTEDFKIVMHQSVDPETYRKMCEIDKEHRPIVERRMERAFNRTSVWERDGCYYYNKIERIKGEPVKTPIEISNFVIHLRNTVIRFGKTFRTIDLLSRFGDSKKNIIINEEQLSNIHKFKQFLMSHGDFMWKGSESNLSSIVEEMFLDNLDIPVQYTDFCGRDESNKLWLFSNMVIADGGKIIKPDKNEIIWSEKVGFKIDSINVGSVKTTLPKLYSEPVNTKEIIDNIYTAWGVQGILATAWTIASIFSNEIMTAHQSFPILFIYGEKESGKSTLSDILMELVGLSSTTPANNICETTPVALTRLLAYYHSLPVRFDEYRESDKKTADKLSLLRSIYNRQGASKGIKDTFGTRQVEINAPLIIVGEQVPIDAALFSRIVLIQLALRNKSGFTIKSLKWLYANKEKLSGLTFQLIKNYTETSKLFLNKIEAAKIDLLVHVDEVKNMRNQLHYAILLSAIDLVYPDGESKAKIMTQMMRTFDSVNIDIKNSNGLAVFFDEVFNMHITHPKYETLKHIQFIGDKGFIYLRGLHGLLIQYLVAPKDSLFFAFSNLSKYMEKQSWCLEVGRRDMGLGDHGMRKLMCYTVDLSHKDTPDGLISLFEEKGYDRNQRNLKINGSENDSLLSEEEFSQRTIISNTGET